MSEADAIRDKDLFLSAIDTAVRVSLRKLGLAKDYVSQREAYGRFGAATIKTWENRGWIKRVQIGGKGKKINYSLTELEVVERFVNQGKLK